MGYTTKFTGSIELSRKLTFAEARDLLTIAEEPENTYAASGINTYLQWVPSEALDEIVWDGNEKFYDYAPLLQWLCGKWLKDLGIAANGELLWSGETASDIGALTVIANELTVKSGRQTGVCGKPLTMESLGRMALDEAAKGGTQ